MSLPAPSLDSEPPTNTSAWPRRLAPRSPKYASSISLSLCTSRVWMIWPAGHTELQWPRGGPGDAGCTGSPRLSPGPRVPPSACLLSPHWCGHQPQGWTLPPVLSESGWGGVAPALLLGATWGGPTRHRASPRASPRRCAPNPVTPGSSAARPAEAGPPTRRELPAGEGAAAGHSPPPPSWLSCPSPQDKARAAPRMGNAVPANHTAA